MEFIVIGTPNNSLSRVMGPAAIELAKKMIEKPEEAVPGGKLIAAYAARTKLLNLTIWEAPSIDSLLPVFEQSVNLGWDMEIIPAEKFGVQLDKVAKAMAALGV